MLQDRDLLMFGGDWNRLPSPLQHIALNLAGRNRILWVGSVSLRRPSFRMYDVRRITERINKIIFAADATTGSTSVFEVHPFVFPFYDSPGVRRMNDVMLRKALLKRMKELDFRNVVSFPSTPLVAGIIGTLGESSSHYFCVDDYSQFDGAYRSVPELEQEMLEEVDSCFAVSGPLLQTRRAKNGETHFLPQGVDTDHFRPSAEPLPLELASIKRPIVGFLGSLASYVDIDLIVQCAKAYPEISFVVIGRPLVNVSALVQQHNTVFLGEIRYENLPHYARAFDVGLNPRVVNQLTLAMNPLKMLEYLSIGMPVVSTDLPAVRKFKDHVYIAETREHFIDLIGKALQDTSQEKRETRRRIAQQFSWKSVTERVSEIIDRIDAAKRSRVNASDIGVNT